MKKILITVAICLAAISCSKSKSLSDSADQLTFTQDRIIFATNTSKAILETTTEVMKNDSVGFKVASVVSGLDTVYFNENAKCDTSTGYFKTQKDYYVVSGKEMTFYAVFPSKVITVDPKANSAKLVNYEVDESTDLVGAKTIGLTEGRAKLDFKHLLSRISVAFVGTDKNVEYKLDSCFVSYTKSGNYTFTDSPVNTDWVNVERDSVRVGKDTTIQTSALDTLLKDKVVIPGKKGENTQIVVSISWTTFDKSKGVYKYYKNVRGMFDANIGKKSQINCKLGNSGQDPIVFEISVDPWEDDKSQEMEFN